MKIQKKQFFFWSKFKLILGFFLSLTPSVQGVNKAFWMDIPVQKALHPILLNNKIGDMVNQYHQIRKSQPELVEERIILLEEIAHPKITENSDNTVFKKEVIKLQKMAHHKAWYLKEIKKIYAYQITHGIQFKNLIIEDHYALCLVNKLNFDYSFPITWGLFYLEFIDPCHRQLTPYYIQWDKEKSQVPFFFWLESQVIPFNIFYVDYFSEKLINECEYYIYNGNILKVSNSEIANFENNQCEYLFIITLDERIFITEGSATIRHTSLSLGKPLLFAGTLKTKNGILKYMDANSGHYQPTPNFLYKALMLFAKKKAYLQSAEVKVMYFINDQQYLENAEDFIKNFSSDESLFHKNKINSEDFKI